MAAPANADRARPPAAPAESGPALDEAAKAVVVRRIGAGPRADPDPDNTSDAADTPSVRGERWLMVAVGAFVPLLLAIAIPGRPKLALLGLGGSMTVLSFVLLVRREHALRARARTGHSPHPALPRAQ